MTEDPIDTGRPPAADIEDTPTIACGRCSAEWSLEYELDELQAGNAAVEQFAMDHKRHTGHYPDGVTPWVADCAYCHAGEEFLREGPARRWATTHARHTGHDVDLEHGSDTDLESIPDRGDIEG